jgi:AbrB family looped-hinge helix DNA binding protein
MRFVSTTIPRGIRERLGILPGDEVEIELDGDAAVIRPVRQGHNRGHRIVERMQGQGTVQMSTDQIMRLTRGRK